MNSQALFLLLLLTCASLCQAQGSFGNCCLGYISRMKKNVRRNIESVKMQEIDENCNIRAVIFTMKQRRADVKPRELCANPDSDWVQSLMDTVAARMQGRN
ncbi:C-C motif chemokine 25b isoform 1-T2 [Aulostomus maculatus]